ncbi:DUF3352 domain-containing protein [Phormidesmis priestleyi ULC007]|uniref:DUF3352 domain-containing protein n=1 Tax=Phormidesmis priestleyi ULC007 TaxID=1920490 RepID=A0A2T1DK77_9CYAN|nr:DUF3352 domain-containing protein [Phormidesmis priestleyi]PSB20873.1 DUF3352 domain-containing protein [Phormidesmis priestleyi ULC007]PZO51828.1 MAG: DUF3352 domain-containing protein [Phormidesmis priestleyi]
MSVKKLILPAVAVTALAGGVAGYFYFNGAPGDSATPLGIAKVIPDQAYMAAFISTDEKNWAKLKQFGTPEAQQAVDKSVKEFQQKVLTESNVDVDKDLKPWMGNVMVAMMPSTNAKEPNVLMAIAIKDKVSALSFANKLKSDAKVKSTETDYKGVKISEVVSEKSKKPSYAAVLKDSYLVLSSDKKAIEQSIETLQGSPSFATKPEAAPLLSQSDGEAVVARFYLPDYAGMVQAMSGSSSAPLNASTLEQLKRVKSMVGNVSIDEVGLRLKGAVKVDPQTAIEFKPSPGKVVAQFPTDTFALVSGANLSSYWSQVVTQSKDSPEAKQVIEAMRSGSQTIGLNLDNDIFGWMNGEFAIGMMPLNQGMLAQLGFGGAMVFNTSDRKTAEATLSKLDTIGKSQSLAIAQRDVNGKKVTEWQTPQGALLGHGWLDDNTVFIAMGDQLVTTMSSQPNPSLETSDSFKAVTASLPKQNIGYFYMDMEKTMTLVNKVTPVSQKSAMQPETTAILNSIKGVGGTTTQTDKTTSQFEAVLALKPAK